MNSPRRLAVRAAAASLVLLLAGPAQASPETLKRSVQNILLAPLDVAFAPIVAGRTIYQNLRDIDDTPAVKVLYPVPGFVWNTGVEIGCGTIREIAGIIEFLPGLGLFFLDTDLDPLFAPAERGNAIVDIYTGPMAIRFGIDYTTQPF